MKAETYGLRNRHSGQSPNPKTARNSLVLKVRKDLFIRCNLVSSGLGWGTGVWHGGASSGWADACCS